MSRKRNASVSQDNIFQGFEYGTEPTVRKASRATDQKVEEERVPKVAEIARTSSPRVEYRDGTLHFPLCAVIRKPYITRRRGGWFRERFSSVSDCSSNWHKGYS